MATDAAAPRDARAKLLEAALAVIRTQGLAATSVEALCKAAGVTKGAFFHHFRSKEDLAVAAAGRFVEMADALFDADWRELPDPAARVLGYVALRRTIVGDDFAAFTCLLGTMAQEAYATSPAVRAACEAGIVGHAMKLAPDMEAALAAAGRQDVDPRGLALHVQAALQGGFILAKATGDPAAATDAIDHLARYLAFLFEPQGRTDPMSYVDGFLVPVPTANREAYRAHAEKFAPKAKELGALTVFEGWGDDVPDGEVTSFPLAVKRKEDETVVFSYIIWPSKEVRDAAWAKIMADPEMGAMTDMPFDGKRMMWGGFAPLVEA